jgi:hypothetical protein
LLNMFSFSHIVTLFFNISLFHINTIELVIWGLSHRVYVHRVSDWDHKVFSFIDWVIDEKVMDLNNWLPWQINLSMREKNCMQEKEQVRKKPRSNRCNSG